jgi:hypothetical protein
MDYYEFEYMVENLIDILKEKKEAEEGQGKKYGEMSPGSLMKDASKYAPSGMKMPKMPSYSPANFPGIPSSLKI